MLFSFNVEVKEMERKTESYIYGSFRNRLREGGWWKSNNELLNMLDINERPSYYKGTVKEWIEEVTTFSYLYPKEWDEIFKQYQSITKRESPLQFFRNEEGYLRMTGVDVVYLKITGEDEALSRIVLNYIGERLSEHAEELFYDYLRCAGMDGGARKCWIESIEKTIRERMEGADLSITLSETLDESKFEGNELYFDLLNDLYMIL